MRPFIAAVWSFNTGAYQSASIAARLNALEDVIDDAATLIRDRARASGLAADRSPKGVFIAPEYLAAQPTPADHGTHQLGDRRHLDEADKDLCLNRFKALSLKYDDILLVPGSVAWRKPIERSGPKALHGPGKVGAGTAKTVSRRDKAEAALRQYADKVGLSHDRPVSGPLQGRDAPTIGDKLTALAQSGPLVNLSGAKYIGRNTAFCLLGGRVLMKYNKMGDFHEVLDGPETIHISGKLTGRFDMRLNDPELRPMRMSLEICLDHAFATAQKDIPHHGDADMHLICSAAVQERRDSVAVRAGGHVVHACCVDAWSGVHRFTAGLLWGVNESVLKPFHESKPPGGPLRCYELDISDNTKNPLIL